MLCYTYWIFLAEIWIDNSKRVTTKQYQKLKQYWTKLKLLLTIWIIFMRTEYKRGMMTVDTSNKNFFVLSNGYIIENWFTDVFYWQTKFFAKRKIKIAIRVTTPPWTPWISLEKIISPWTPWISLKIAKNGQISLKSPWNFLVQRPKKFFAGFEIYFVS